MTRNYIARKFVLINEYGGKDYYDEGVFGSYEEAYRFIQYISEEDDDCFLSEITSYITDSFEPLNNRQIWYFEGLSNELCIRFFSTPGSTAPDPRRT